MPDPILSPLTDPLAAARAREFRRLARPRGLVIANATGWEALRDAALERADAARADGCHVADGFAVDDEKGATARSSYEVAAAVAFEQGRREAIG